MEQGEIQIMPEKNKMNVQINGREVTLIHDEQEDYIQRIVLYLNNKIQAITKGSVKMNEAAELSLTAINITDELFKAQKNFVSVKNEAKRLMDEYEDLKRTNNMLSNQVEQLDYSRPVSLFAQTTQDPVAFLQLCRNIEFHYQQHGIDPAHYFRAFNTICKQVAERKPILHEFAKDHHTLIFVSGKESSNGKVLFEACREANTHSFHIENSTELCSEWFTAGTSVGVCGATSTPKWLMEEVARVIREM